MGSRAEAAGDMAVIRGRLASRYDMEAENEVRKWVKELVKEDLVSGMREMEKQLRDGTLLVKIAQVVQQNSPKIKEKAKKMTLKINTNAVPFKQMENIQVFINFCKAYGVPKGALFQTVDLYEGRNMAQVLSCIQLLGSECQRNGFNGTAIGPKPLTKNERDFSADQMRAGEGLIGLQSGTNKFATQKGMKIGSVRHCADIRADIMNKDSQVLLILQSGWNKGANQTGMSMGSVRHGSDIKSEPQSKDSNSLLILQSGWNKGANQAGMSMGGTRHGADIRADDTLKEAQGLLPQQSGWNKGATQTGMSIGGVRHGADIRADDTLKESQGIVTFQAGWTKGASQTGMSIGGVRHGADIRADDLLREGEDVVPYQMGSNKYANQAGMHMGKQRHVADIRTDQPDQAGQGVISIQYGSGQGDNQSGMQIGGRRDIRMKFHENKDTAWINNYVDQE